MQGSRRSSPGTSGWGRDFPLGHWQGLGGEGPWMDHYSGFSGVGPWAAGVAVMLFCRPGWVGSALPLPIFPPCHAWSLDALALCLKDSLALWILQGT